MAIRPGRTMTGDPAKLDAATIADRIEKRRERFLVALDSVVEAC